MPPFLVLRRAGVVPWVVTMYRHHQPILHHIFGQDQVVHCQIGVADISRYADVSCLILSSRCADGVHAHLIPLVQHSVLRTAIGQVSASAPLAVLYLVQRLEDEVLALVAETLCYLQPDHRQLLLNLLISLFVRHRSRQVQPMGTLARCVISTEAIVVDIDNHLEVVLLRHQHQLLHAVEPVLLQGVRRRTAYMPHPCDGDADRTKAGFLKCAEGVFRRLGVPPTGLVRLSVEVRVHLVSEVPSHAHGERKIHCALLFRAFVLLLTYGATHRGQQKQQE